jgi:hypothetical protein
MYVGQMEMHKAELLVPDPGPFEVEIAITNLKQYKSPGSDQFLVELIQAGGKTLVSAVHKLIRFTRNEDEWPISGRSLLVYYLTEKADKNNCRNYSVRTLLQFHTKCYRISFTVCPRWRNHCVCACVILRSVYEITVVSIHSSRYVDEEHIK